MALSGTHAARIASQGIGSAILAVVLAACGTPGSSTTAPPSGSPPATASSSAAPLQLSVTLDDTACALEGDSELPAGPVAIHMDNATDGQFDLDLWRLQDGHSYDELVAHIDEEMRRITSGEPPLGHPDFADLVDESTAAAGMDGELRSDLLPGLYGFACIYFQSTDVLGAIRPAGPLEVS